MNQTGKISWRLAAYTDLVKSTKYSDVAVCYGTPDISVWCQCQYYYQFLFILFIFSVNSFALYYLALLFCLTPLFECKRSRSWPLEGSRTFGQRRLSDGCLGAEPFGRQLWKPWQLSFQLLIYQSITLVNPNTIWGVINFISRTHIKQEFIPFMNPTSIAVIRRRFHQHNIYCLNENSLHASSF